MNKVYLTKIYGCFFVVVDYSMHVSECVFELHTCLIICILHIAPRHPMMIHKAANYCFAGLCVCIEIMCLKPTCITLTIENIIIWLVFVADITRALIG